MILLLAMSTPLQASCARVRTETFTNPLVISQDAADPWMVYHAGFYYFTATLDPSGGIWVWKSRTLAGLDSGTKVKVHTPDSAQRGKQIWAPELHFINNRWYIYYTASDGVDENHRLYVLESGGRDPLGPYSFKARIYDPAHDGWALDPSVFRAPGDGRLYLLWVAHVPGNGNGIRIAPMSNPWTVAGESALIAQANYNWERVRYPINEGPVVLERANRIFLIYSASDTGTPDYALGMLTHTGGDVTDPKAWKKSPDPVFGRYSGADGNVFGPGHNGFFKSPDGSEDWIIYHGKETSGYTYAGRTARAQKFRWRPDNTPDFGRPVPRGVPLRVPSGEDRSGAKSRFSRRK